MGKKQMKKGSMRPLNAQQHMDGCSAFDAIEISCLGNMLCTKHEHRIYIWYPLNSYFCWCLNVHHRMILKSLAFTINWYQTHKMTYKLKYMKYMYILYNCTYMSLLFTFISMHKIWKQCDESNGKMNRIFRAFSSINFFSFSC